jgi:arylsulfatase A-like enzyme
MKKSLYSIILLFFLTLFLLSCSTGAKKDKTPQKPNIIYILADDLGYGDLSCYGQEKFETPNIDKIAKTGVLFTDHYAGCTVCAPSRSSLMDGKHTGHTYIRGNKGMKPEGQHPIPSSTKTVAKLLKKAGYATGAYGKWGLGGPGSDGVPWKQGFDKFYGYLCQSLAHNYYPEYLWDNNKKVYLEGNKNDGVGQYGHDEYHNMALEFIDNHKDEPFFLFCPYIIPHAELLAPEDDLWEQYDGKFPEKKYKGSDKGSRRYRKGGYGSQEKPHTAFAAMVARLDRSVGEILSKLDELGIAENTLVIFTSDNGPHKEGGADPRFFNSSGPLQGHKRSLYEGGIRVPFVACWPGQIPKNSKSDHPSAFWDFLPTAAELAEIDTPKDIDGISMLPALIGNSGNQKKHKFLYWEFHEGGTKQAVRMGKWKAVRFGTEEPLELYDLSKDIHEDNNIAENNPTIVKEIEQYLENARSESDIWSTKKKWPENKRKY